MKTYARKETWGYFVWQRRGGQFAAGVGLDVSFRLGRALTTQEARIWRKHGVLRLS